MSHQIDLRMIPGKQGPLYPEGTVELKCKHVAITEQGTELNLPIVDIVMEDASGKQFLFVTTGRLMQAIGDAVSGANLRNHGEKQL